MNRLETVGRTGHDPDAGDLLSLGVLHGVSPGNQACRGSAGTADFRDIAAVRQLDQVLTVVAFVFYSFWPGIALRNRETGYTHFANWLSL